MKEAAKRVIDERLASRVRPNSAAPMDDDQIECIANTVLNHIDYALALDLDRRPRLSRTNAGKLLVAVKVAAR